MDFKTEADKAMSLADYNNCAHKVISKILQQYLHDRNLATCPPMSSRKKGPKYKNYNFFNAIGIIDEEDSFVSLN